VRPELGLRLGLELVSEKGFRRKGKTYVHWFSEGGEFRRRGGKIIENKESQCCTRIHWCSQDHPEYHNVNMFSKFNTVN
jgi:hypothetical protein